VSIPASAKKQLSDIADRIYLFATTAKMPASPEILKKWSREIKEALKEKPNE